MPEESGITLVARDEYSKVFAQYDKDLAGIERSTESTAKAITQSGETMSEWQARQMELLRAESDAYYQEHYANVGQMEDQMDSAQAGATRYAGALGKVAPAATLAAGAVAALIMAGKGFLDFIEPALAGSQELTAAQERFNAEMDKSREVLAQAAAPALVEYTNLKISLLQAILPVLEALRDFAAYVHIGAMAIGEFGKEFGGFAAILANPLQTLPMVAKGMFDAQTRQESWDRVLAESVRIWDRYHAELKDTAETVSTYSFTPSAMKTETDYDQLATSIQSAFDRIQRLQEDHARQLAREEEDAARTRARAWQDYERNVSRTIASGEKKTAELIEEHAEEAAKSVTEAQRQIARAEQDAYQERTRAEEDFQRQMKQAHERYELDRLQSQRRYQYELNKLIAEGDTLAIQDLKEQYALEQAEAAENQALEESQSQENQGEKLERMAEDAQAALDELRQQLADALAEQEAAYQEQLARQQEAQAERLAEMAADWALRQEREEEDRTLATQRRDEDYQRQLEDLGGALADQLQEYEYGSETVSDLLGQYYGEGGVADEIMAGFHEREEERINVTTQAMQQMAVAYSDVALGGETEGYPATGYGVGMQAGGVVTGPRRVYVEPGVTEAFMPLNRGGAGGNFNVSWRGGAIPLSGLEKASPENVNAVAQMLATGLLVEFRSLRRR